YLPFPYPLHHVQGLATAHNWHWTLHDIEGRGGNDSTIVKCRGESTPTRDGCHTDLTFEATNVPLDDNLKSALSPDARRGWDDLQPDGRIDLSSHVIHETGQPQPEIEV